MEKKTERIKAVMIGHAVGDALGVPVEFESRRKLEKHPVTDMMGYGTYHVPAGAWSDDTSMAVAALDSLADGAIHYREIMENFVKWLDGGRYTPTGHTFDVGGTCMRAIMNFTYDPKQNPTECGLSGDYSNGNGSLMRIHPFVMMTYFCEGLRGERDAVAENGSSLTHAHERSKLACKIYARILFALLDDPSKESVSTALAQANAAYTDSAEHETYARLFVSDFAQTKISDIRSSGYVVDTLEAAVWCLLTTETYGECVLKAVNLGEDTDTVAAIAGGLAGALYGYEAIPKKWREALLERQTIEAMCERAAQNWT
ncbi:MAG: ADP-ribosylglycohydrolase family protein [Clostridia bacterium]|nr:ADP-ribosylglycohydrolase family protein [Clostridia bacterium]